MISEIHVPAIHGLPFFGSRILERRSFLCNVSVQIHSQQKALSMSVHRSWRAHLEAIVHHVPAHVRETWSTIIVFVVKSSLEIRGNAHRRQIVCDHEQLLAHRTMWKRSTVPTPH